MRTDLPVPPLTTAQHVPQALADIVHRMVAKNPDERYPSAAEVLSDLNAVPYGEADLSAFLLARLPEALERQFVPKRHRFVLPVLCALSLAAGAALLWLPGLASHGRDVPRIIVPIFDPPIERRKRVTPAEPPLRKAPSRPSKPGKRSLGDQPIWDREIPIDGLRPNWDREI